MRKLAVCFLILLSCSLSFAEKSQSKAVALYVPIMCADMPRGTGFPVGENLLMTAGHVRCDQGDETKISLDAGKTWVVEENWFVSQDEDIAILVTKAKFGIVARFRKPELGESVSGYGIPYGGLLSSGVVAHLEDGFVFTTNIPIGGMSGSAIVGTDGKVIGMTNFGLPDERVGGTLSGGYAGDFLAQALESFKDFQDEQE